MCSISFLCWENWQLLMMVFFLNDLYLKIFLGALGKSVAFEQLKL